MKIIYRILAIVISMVASVGQAYTTLPGETDSLTWHQATVLGAFATPLKNDYINIEVPSPRAGNTLPVRIWKTKKKPLGLVILIPGTGGNADSPQAAGFASNLVEQGYDSLIVANPFSMDFQRTFSRDYFIGFPQNDSLDVVKMVEASYTAYSLRRGSPRIVHLAGVSLGGTYALRFAHLPTKLKISKYIAVNPPVRFANAIENIDKSIRVSLSETAVSPTNIIVNILLPLVNLAWIQQIQLNITSMDRFIGKLSKDEVVNKAIIGASFQQSLRGITKGLLRSERYSDLTSKRVLMRNLPSITFARYMGIAGNAIQSEHIRSHTFEYLIDEGDLDVQIRSAPDRRRLFVIHSEDDFLLSPGDLNLVESYLGSNLQVLKSGGHCGALWTEAFSKAIGRVLKK